ncbi:Xaa-Pro dipeptidyl-peptidase [Streptoalloteichus hindustanus]|uniref:Xaa-Pro dipeptidyl-peptidase n=1 Tax=Streptoalloteichus hindustanus TaxID=2017 RepID=A0A1M5B739_STRHI|nr:Xaa-Pro dipeptidyl-peptidase [Streptoalloteichus hindustanus]SHF38117.1 X-Pro dipeptidyl-peptidase [Streptoalloteichus hindustanus]
MRSARAALLAALVALPLTGGIASAAPPGPVFADGQAQPVYDPADVVREDVWVRAPVDSDGDGKDDEVHLEVVRPRATDQGVRVPVVYQASPYFSGGNKVANHNVDVELHVPERPGRPGGRSGQSHDTRGDERVAAALGSAGPNALPIGWQYEQFFVSRGYAVVYGESLGTGKSTGCPTTGGRNETIGAKSVVDWLNGRASARNAKGEQVRAGWTTGKTGMMGVSYNGTLPNAVATTGVRGLEAIVPIGAISSWYDYYRADGAVVAPGGYQGEDADVLAEYVHTRSDRAVCKPVIEKLAKEQDRITGDYNQFWDERNYLNDVGRVRAAVLAVHGLNDWNVKTKQVAQWYDALKRHGVPHKIWLHQSGHVDPLSLRREEWLRTVNRWFTRYLHGQHNGVESEPKATLQREDKSWVNEPEWPAPGTFDAELRLRPGGSGTGGLSPYGRHPGAPVSEKLTDDATKRAEDLASAANSDHRLAYLSEPARADLRVSGTTKVDARLSFDRPAANVTALLVDRAPDGSTHVITRGWADPQNRHDAGHTQPIRPGQWYRVGVEMQPDDYVLKAGHRLGLVVLSSDHDFTLRPKPGAGVTVDVSSTRLVLPVVGGPWKLFRSVG